MLYGSDLRGLMFVVKTASSVINFGIDRFVCVKQVWFVSVGEAVVAALCACNGLPRGFENWCWVFEVCDTSVWGLRVKLYCRFLTWNCVGNWLVFVAGFCVKRLAVDLCYDEFFGLSSVL